MALKLRFVNFALDTGQLQGLMWTCLRKRKKKNLQGMPLSEVTPGLFTGAMVTDLLD